MPAAAGSSSPALRHSPHQHACRLNQFAKVADLAAFDGLQHQFIDATHHRCGHIGTQEICSLARSAATVVVITDTAIDGIRREADKAGMTLADALAMCCKRGWQGFEADWVKDKPGPNLFAGSI